MKKKLLQFISIMLVLTMLLPMIPIGVFATEQEEEQQQTPTYENINNIYKVDGYNTAKPDGTLAGAQGGNVDEYSTTVNLNRPVAYSSSTTFGTLNDSYSTDTRVAESMSISFAHDASKIYIGVVGKSATSGNSSGQIRDGYQLRLGFDPAHPEYYIGLDLLEIADNMVQDSNDPSKTIVHDVLDMNYEWSFARFMGIHKSNGNAGSFAVHHGSGTKYVEGTAYPITAMKVVKQSANDTDGDGTLDAIDIRSGSSHGRTHNQVYTYWEIEFDKATLLSFFNSMYGEGGVADLNTMLFAVSQYYGLSDNGYVPQSMWNGSFGDTSSVSHAMQAYKYDMVQFNAAKGNVYNVDGYKSAKPDGTLAGAQEGNVGEYSTTVNLDSPVAYSASQTFQTLNDYSTDTRIAESMSISFAHDASKIYIGVVGKGGTTGASGIIRDGYALRLGFDPAHPENYLGISLIEACHGGNVDAKDPSKTQVHDAFAGTDWYQTSHRGIVTSHGSYDWNNQGSGSVGSGTVELSNGSTRTVYGSNNASTYPITAMKVVKQTVSGEAYASAGSGYGRTSEQVYTYWEIEFDKDLLLAFFNEMYSEGAGVPDLDTMLFSVSQFFGLGDNGYVPQSMWNGSFHEGVENKSHAMEAYVYDVVQFSDATTYKVDGYRNAVADGTLAGAQEGNVSEYSTTVNLNRPVAYSGSKTFETLSDAYSTDTRVAESMSISFAHDATKIYIGVVGKGATSGDGGVIRDGYQLRLGFDPAHPEYYIGLDLLEIADNMQVDSNDPSKTIVHDALSTSYGYSFAKYMGIHKSNGNAGSFTVHHASGTKYVEGTPYPITAMKVVKQTTDGSAIDIRSGYSHGRTFNQVYTYWEIELDKATLLSFFNGMYTEGGVADLNTMLFAVSQYYGLANNGYVPQSMWNGSFGDTSSVSHAMQAYTYDQVVFESGECPHTSYTFVETVAPTCIDQGYDIYACDLCEQEEHRNFTDTTDHTHVLTSNVPATCTTAGSNTYTCSVAGCGNSYTSTVNATGHNWVAGEGNVAKYCDNDGCDAQITVSTSSVYSTNATAADGTINDGEYTRTITYNQPVFITNYPVDGKYDSAATASESVTVGFSHDADSIYIGITDLSADTTSTIRQGYTIRFGFDPAHPEYYVGLHIACADFSPEGNGANNGGAGQTIAAGGTSKVSDLLQPTSVYEWAQGGARGLALSAGQAKWQANLSDFTGSKPTDGLTRLYYTSETAATYPITSMKMTKKAGSNDITFANHGRTSGGQVTTYLEIEIDKDLMKAFFNQAYDTENGETPVVDLNTMLFSMATVDTQTGHNVIWNGTMHEDYATDYAAKQTSYLESYGFDRVVFDEGECPHTNCTFVETVAPTCTEQGYDIYSCDVCGHEEHRNFTEATGHSYVQTGGTSATCTTAGDPVYTCSECGNSYSTTVKATGHNWVAGEGNVAKYCDNDGCDAQITVSTSSVYSTNATAADGTINKGEYVRTITYDQPVFITNYPVDGKYDSAATASESVTVGFSHDADSIYIGITDLSADTTSTIRQGYTIRFGFDPAHPENYVGLEIQCADFSPEGNGANNGGAGQTIAAGGTSKVSDLLQPTAVYEWAQAGARGLALSNGKYKWQANLSDFTSSKPSDGFTHLYYTTGEGGTAETYPITSMKMTKKAGSNDITFANHGRTSGGQVTTYLEIEIDKELMLAFFNLMYDAEAGETPVVDLNTMLFSMATVDTQTGYNVLWNGTMHEDYATDYAANQSSFLQSYGFDRVVFEEGECPHANYSFVKTVAPTCTEQGYDIYACDGCGLEEHRNPTNATGHSYVQTGGTSATCTTAGAPVYTCSGCGNSYSTTVKATGHNWVAGEGNVAKYCNNDGCDAQITVSTTTAYRANATVADGTINNGEYARTIRYNQPVFITNYPVDGKYDSAATASESVTVGFSHDADSIYIGITDLSADTTSTIRQGYTIRFGFDPAHPENYVGLHIACADFSPEGNGANNGGAGQTIAAGGTSKVSDLLQPTAVYEWAQAGARGLALSNGKYKWQANLSDFTGSKPTDGLTRLYYTSETAATYPITSMKMTKKAGSNDITFANHGRTSGGQVTTYLEIEIDKELMLAFFNLMYDAEAGETPVVDLNTMLFSMATVDTQTGHNVLWNGTMHEDYATDYAVKQTSYLESYGFDRVVFEESECTHDNYSFVKTVAPTCTEQGYDIYACDVCGLEEHRDFTEKTPHTHVLTSEVPATCTKNGSQTYTCSGCGDSYTTTLKATGHNWVVGEGNVAKYCNNDGCDTQITVAVTTVEGYAYKGSVTADGTIGNNEYTQTLIYDTPAFITNRGETTVYTNVTDEYQQYQSERVEVRLSHNSEKIYIGITDLSGMSTKPSYKLRFGFDPAHPENYVGMYMEQANFTVDPDNPSKSLPTDMIAKAVGEWDRPQAGYYGLALSHGNYGWDPLGSSAGIETIKYTDETESFYPITAMKVSKESVDGDLLIGNGYTVTSGPHYTYIEIEIDKDLMIAFFNRMYGDGKGITDLNTMMFSVQTGDRQETGYFPMWNGSLSDTIAQSHILNSYGFDRVVFVDCPHTEWSNATCDAPKTCKACGQTEGTALGHNVTEVIVERVDPTCIAAGKSAVMGCTRCDYEEGGTVIPKLGHNFVNQICTKCNANLDELGQNTGYTGLDYNNGSGITIDGVIDDKYVCVTPGGADNVFVTDKAFGNGTTASGVTVTQSTEVVSGNKKEFTDSVSTNFYVAQDNENIYIAVKLSVKDISYILSGSTYNNTENIYSNLKLGFNPKDYTQQITFFSHGGYASKGEDKTNSGITYSGWQDLPFIMQGFSDSDSFTYKIGTASNIIGAYVDDNNWAKDSYLEVYKENGTIVRIYELKLNKAAIIAAYEEQFSATVDFSSMFIGMDSRDYAWTNNGEASSLYWVSGTVIDSDTAAANTVSTYIPYRVVFDAMCPGADVEHTEHNCQYYTIVQEGDCTTDAFEKAICYKCDKEFYLSYTPAPGHSYEQDGTIVQCTVCGYICGHPNIEGGYCPDCNHSGLCSHEGTMEYHAPKNPTCIAIGWDAYEQCTVCGYKAGFNQKEPLRWTSLNTQAEINSGDHTSLAEFGQKIYATGTKNYMAANGVMHLDGDNDIYEPYVEVTPQGGYVNKIGLDAQYYNKYNSSGVIVNNSSSNIDYTSNLKYFVAQDDDNVYLLIEDHAPFVDANGNQILDARHESILRNFAYNVRIGFDTEHYDRALLVRLENNANMSFYVVNGEEKPVQISSSSAIGGALVQTAFERYNNNGNPSGQKKNSNYWNESDSVVNQWVARFEIKIDKNFVDEAYALLNDNKSKNFDFNTMFLSVSTYAIRYQADGSLGYSYAMYGAYPGADGIAAGLPENYVPDVIVFGEDKQSSLTTAHNCDLTDHRIDEKYLYNRVDNGDGTGIAEFYHTCKNVSTDGRYCSVVGATTFKVTYSTVDGEIVYDSNVILGQPEGIPTNPNVIVTPATCTQPGTYYNHCSCGAEGKIDYNNTYQIDALGHNWIDDDRNYRTPNYCPSCKETSDSVYITQPEEKKSMNILMIGNSFCYYFVEELYAIAHEAGIELNVANLYVSGRSVYEHYQHILGNNTLPYEFYVTNSSGRNQINSVTTIDGALAYAKSKLGGDWDVISFQQHFYPNMAMNYNSCISDTLSYANELFDYVKDTGTQAKLYWQQSWAYQVGYNRKDVNGNLVDGSILTEAVQMHTYRNIKKASEEVAQANGVTLVPSGDAWQIVRNEYDYDGLCDKPGNSGDYYHDGDVGGGQYLNACVWFETVTGYSCLGNTWRPDDESVAEESRYSLNINAEYLQEAAHKAVAQIYGPGYARHEHCFSKATCTTPEMCLFCGLEKEGSAALGHINKHGQIFTDLCTDDVAERECTRCGLYINLKHDFDENNTCTVCQQHRTGWIVPEGITTHYATDVEANKPSIDGEIGLDEYGKKITVKTPSVLTDYTGNRWSYEDVDKTRAAEYMDYYFAYDEDNIYIALREVSNGIISRSNYRFEFGFDLDDVTKYFMFEGFITNGTGEGGWAVLNYYDNNSKKVAPLATYDLIGNSFVRKVDSETHTTLSLGDLSIQNGNKNYSNKKWELIVEFKLSKEDVIKCMNDLYGTNYTTLSDAMWIAIGARTYDASIGNVQNLKWIGQNDVSQYLPDGINSNWKNDWMFDVVVFGDENTDIMKANPDPCNGSNHTLESYPAKAPTATESGHEAYQKCTVCNYKVDYVEIPPYDVFKTGYSRVDISPKVSQAYPIGGFDRGADALYATCVAVNDGQDSAMFISIDIKSINEANNRKIRELVEIATGIPADNVFVSATHTHSSFTFNTDENWKFESFKGIMEAAEAAVEDLEVTETYIGSAEATGSYVRRYKQVEVSNWSDKETATGLFRSRNPGGSSSGIMNSTVWRTVADADQTLQVVRLVRDGKDIVMTNWQAHLAHAVQTSGMTTSISSDIAHYMREDIEKGDTDTQVIYFAGASGNITLTDTDSESVENYKKVAQDLAATALGIIQVNKMEKIESGKIEVDVQTYQALTRKDGKDATKYPYGTAKFNEMYYQMYEAPEEERKKFTDYTMAERYFYEGNDCEYKELRLGAVAIGELGFVVAPYEMFDTNGEFIKEESAKLGFKMTFILTNAGGDYAYMPSAEYYTEAYGYSGDYLDTESTDYPGTYLDEGDWGDPYEVIHSYFGVGTAEATADKFVEMLAALWARGEVVDINIVYTSMSFTYTPGLWNPNELMYDEGTWTADSTDGGQITVTNYSRAQLSVTFAFDAEDDYEFLSGVFRGTGDTSLVDDVASLSGRDQIYVTFTLAGFPTGPLDNVTVGHITITIGEATVAAGGE